MTCPEAIVICEECEYGYATTKDQNNNDICADCATREEIKQLRAALKALVAVQPTGHYSCEDDFYSCPAYFGKPCDCGFDDRKPIIDTAKELLKI